MKRKGIFDEFFREFEEMDKVFDSLFEGFRRGEVKGLEEPLYYGISIHVGPEGVPKVTHFGNIRPELTGEVHGDEREPFTDVITDEKTGEVIVTLEMPGIKKEDIELETGEDFLTVSAESEKRKYHKKVRLDEKIKPDTAKAKYNNGVLEIKAKLQKPLKKGKKIKVD